MMALRFSVLSFLICPLTGGRFKWSSQMHKQTVGIAAGGRSKHWKRENRLVENDEVHRSDDIQMHADTWKRITKMDIYLSHK